MSRDSSASPIRRNLKRTWRAAIATPGFVITLVLIVVVAAHTIRDRTLWLAFICYVPLWPVGVTALIWDLIRRGRSLPLRWLLLCLGFATSVLGVGAMWGPRLAPEVAPRDGQPITLLHWNVRWGGTQGAQSLPKIVAELRRRDADIMLISEFPWPQWFFHEFNGGKDAANITPPAQRFSAVVGEGQGVAYWVRVGLVSRWPVRIVRDWRLPDGRAGLFEVDAPVRTIRVIAVDVESSPYVHRAPSLRAVGEILRDLAAEGIDVDFVAGDLNSPARAYGFDAITTADDGFRRAALWSGQWRATWPSVFPFWDIDHVLVSKRLSMQSCELFAIPDATDHRGQIVRVLVDAQ